MGRDNARIKEKLMISPTDREYIETVAATARKFWLGAMVLMGFAAATFLLPSFYAISEFIYSWNIYIAGYMLHVPDIIMILALVLFVLSPAIRSRLRSVLSATYMGSSSAMVNPEVRTAAAAYMAGLFAALGIRVGIVLMGIMVLLFMGTMPSYVLNVLVFVALSALIHYPNAEAIENLIKGP